MRPVEVVHLIWGLETGGAETMLYKLLARSDSSRVRSSVVSMVDEGTLGPRIRELGVPLHTLGMRRGVPDPRAVWRLSRLLRTLRPQVLQTWLYHADLLGLIAGRVARLPSVAWNVRCSDMRMEEYSLVSRQVVRLLARLSALPDAVVVNSEAGRRHHSALGYRPRRWELIPNGFDTDEFRPRPEARSATREAMGLDAESFAIGLVARFDPMKDHATFLRAARRLLELGVGAEFVLVGRDVTPENSCLHALVEQLGLSRRVHLLGERADLAALYPALDVAALSSAFGEGFPNVVGEAMSCGVPCVVTDTGDSAALLGDAGLVVPPGDADALARAWRVLHDLSDEGRRAIGASGRRKIVSHFGIGAVVERYHSLHERLAADAAGR